MPLLPCRDCGQPATLDTPIGPLCVECARYRAEAAEEAELIQQADRADEERAWKSSPDYRHGWPKTGREE